MGHAGDDVFTKLPPMLMGQCIGPTNVPVPDVSQHFVRFIGRQNCLISLLKRTEMQMAHPSFLIRPPFAEDRLLWNGPRSGQRSIRI